MKQPQGGTFSLLPPLELRSDGDGNVESLDHYVSRLAHCVGLSVYAVARMLTRPPLPPGLELLRGNERRVWIGPGERVQEVVDRLAAASGVPDLYRATFLHLTPALSSVGFANFRSSSSSRKWCPCCYLEWDDYLSFEPLYWAFGALSVCPIHHCRMQSRCQSCGRRQHHGTRYPCRRNCRTCFAPLGYHAEIVSTSAYPAWINRQCVMTAHVASNTQRPVAPDCFDRYFERVLSRWRDGEPIPRHVKASMSSLERRWNAGERNLKPTIMQYMNFAAFHGTNVDEIMLLPESAAAEPLVEGEWRSFEHFTLRRTLRTKLGKLQSALERLLKSEIPHLPATGAVCAFFEIELHYARRYASRTIEAYSAKVVAQNKSQSRPILRRAYSCAISLARLDGEDSPRSNKEDAISAIASRARCTLENARWAHQAALITVSCL